MPKTHAWWQRGCIYQVYPRSFQDSDGDGIGDLAGVTARLDYLADLGVEGVWLSPVFPSPMRDFGYDVSDYTGIDPLFGTLADFDALLAKAHARGLKVLLDFVPNHTSDEHLWFQESRSSRTNPKRSWYIWRDPAAGGGAPNNWLSQFGGRAWTLDRATGQYYCHSFLASQPDLNWRNPEVVQAMLEAMRFWLDRGVDGFRVDALHHVIKDDQFRDNPADPSWQPGMPEQKRLRELYTTDRPELADVIYAMRRLADEYKDRVLVGEMYLPLDRLMRYYGENNDAVHLPFNFHLLRLAAPWSGTALAELIEGYEAVLPPGGWPNWVLGNHDRPRVASRVGQAGTRVAAMLLLTLRGAPTLYYGDELGMEDVPIPAERVQDPWEKNEPGLGLGRDPVRTPMPWDGSAYAGFSTAEPWLPLGGDWQTRNVEALDRDPRSILALYRQLLALRRAEPALAVGSYRTVAATENVLVYVREAPGAAAMLVALNFSSAAATVALPPEAGKGRVLLSTESGGRSRDGLNEVVLRPHEGVIVALA